METSVFVEPFKLQERETIDKDNSLLYHERDLSDNGRENTEKGLQGTESRFSVSFAQDESQTDMPMVRVTDTEPSMHIDDKNMFGGSLINQIQGNHNLFSIFKAKEM